MFNDVDLQKILLQCSRANELPYIKSNACDQKIDANKPEIFSSLKKISKIADSISVEWKYGTFSIQYKKNQILAEYKIKL